MADHLIEEGMSLYLAGPMTGHKDWNFPAFNAAARELRERGYLVFNPAEQFGGETSLGFTTYLRHDLGVMLSDCDAIVMLPGWRHSPGAVLEHAVAIAIGLGRYAYLDGMLLTLDCGIRSPRKELAVLMGVSLT